MQRVRHYGLWPKAMWRVVQYGNISANLNLAYVQTVVKVQFTFPLDALTFTADTSTYKCGTYFDQDA